MKLLGLPVLEKFKQSHADARGPLDAWRALVERETWRTTHDIRQRYGSADFLPENRVIFNIKGNHYRLVIKVQYRNGLVLVEWVGTHAEYSKKVF